MSARFGHTELPEEQAAALAKARRLEIVTLVVTSMTIALVLLVAGNSQAMKAAWIEDSLALLPPLAFLIALRFVRRRPTPRNPYGLHRSTGVAHLVSAVALLVMGSYLAVDSAMGIVMGDHPPIGLMEVFGITVWQGWLTIAVMAVVAIPPMILGRMKLKLAPILHDKVLYADAKMNKADWMTAAATIVGVLGIGVGWWWADGAAAIIVSVDIIRDGWTNMRDAVKALMDSRATAFDGTGPDPLGDEVVNTLRGEDWVADADCRMRDQGHVLHIEAFVVPVDDQLPSLQQLADLRERCVELSWRVQDLVVVVVEELPEEFLPQLAHTEPQGTVEPDGSVTE